MFLVWPLHAPAAKQLQVARLFSTLRNLLIVALEPCCCARQWSTRSFFVSGSNEQSSIHGCPGLVVLRDLIAPLTIPSPHSALPSSSLSANC